MSAEPEVWVQNFTIWRYIKSESEQSDTLKQKAVKVWPQYEVENIFISLMFNFFYSCVFFYGSVWVDVDADQNQTGCFLVWLC